MIELRQGDILEAPAEALVNTVNTVGVMGKGVALQFKRAFPDNFKAYAKVCERRKIDIGRIFVYPRNTLENPRYIINFPTKHHWRERSRLKYIRLGLDDLVHQIRQLHIQSVALPPLGCGNGGLDWGEVRPLIESASDRLPKVEFIVYEPQVVKEPRLLAVKSQKPNLTLVRAALLKIFAAYEALDESIGRLEAQKLAYFLQSAGFVMPRVEFTKGKYGPYAEVLNKVLEDLEGYYFEGFGDRTTYSNMRLKSDVNQQVDSFLDDHPEAREYLNRTQSLISGFESPYGMELLATVHWVACHEGAEDFDSIIEAVQSWSKHKKYAFDEAHLRVAWEHLLDEGWITAKTLINQ